MYKVNISGNTSVVSKSSSDWLNYTGILGETPLRKKKAIVFTNVTANVYQGQLNTGFSKVCEIFKVHGIESLKYVESFTHRFVIVATFPRPKRDAERNEL